MKQTSSKHLSVPALGHEEPASVITVTTDNNARKVAVSTRNRFEPLRDNEDSTEPTQDRTNDRTNDLTRVIIGDSIVKNLQGPKLGKEVGHRVVVKAFLGATVKDMKSYIKPTIETSPDKILLHIGTNDLKSCGTNNVADSIVDLAKEIEATCDAEIILSELTTRRDSLNDAVKAVNKRLNQFCRQHQWKLSVTTTSLRKNLIKEDCT